MSEQHRRRGPDRPIDVLAIGDASVDMFIAVPRLPGRDDKVMGRLLGVHGGGMSANFAAAAAHQQSTAALVAVIGSDERGRACVDELARHGVDVSRVRTVPDAETWQCVLQLDPTGEKALTGADTGLKIPETSAVDDETLARSALVHPLADDPRWAAELAQRAKAQGALVAVDLETAALSGGLEAAARLLSHTDLAFTNRGALAAAGFPDPGKGIAALRECGPGTVVVTLGAEGAICESEVDKLRCAAVPVEVADSTGAGDAFNGAFAGAYVRGEPLTECLRRAAAMAALAVGSVGSRTYEFEPTCFGELMRAVTVSSLP